MIWYCSAWHVSQLSRMYYPTLSLVSKSFRSLVSSPELYKTRSLKLFESCLYVCLQTLDVTADWYTLCLKPDKTLNKKNKTRYALARVPAYDPKQSKWDMVGRGMRGRMRSDAYCVIGNVLYSASNGVFKWYDTEGRRWRDLQGLVGLPKITTPRHDRGIIRLGDYGGKMVVFWGHVSIDPCSLSCNCWSCRYTEIWCAEISLERRQGGEIWGKVEWFDLLLEINGPYRAEQVLSTTM
ncbi:unnamed protein product [Eruca vesicaria subsp. sativa]|uniref:F-box domain-containing protein n=1 Tax=Eruca vesicaria subsp. sativa TaxID=29727 RepID=A0ABC8JDC3_ERUVS|nr:unnamed protein product [Eruca vesicaria subsp. sativa]